MRRRPKPESFEKFYMSRVALGENCGCAERVIDHRDLDRLKRDAMLRGPGLLTRLWRWTAKRWGGTH